ncbi:MAG: ATP synthase F1 subunit delta [Bacteroidales bacterium]
MRNPKLANRYAKALFQFAIENESLESVNQDLILIKEVLKENRDLRLVIESPIIHPDKKMNIFREIFSEKISKISLGFLGLIIRKKREPALVIICEEFVIYYNQYHNIKVVNLVTAVPFGDKLLDQIKNMLERQTHSTIQIVPSVNPDVIGGLVLIVEGYLFDASIHTRINKLKAEFSQNNYQAGF